MQASYVVVAGANFGAQYTSASLTEETIMENQEALLNEIYEKAIENDMTYFG
jgi:hypothetical protein